MWIEGNFEDTVVIRNIRRDYVRVLNNWDERLREWISIRDSFDRLESLNFYMSDSQWNQFNQLQSDDLVQNFEVGEFDLNQLFIRQHLLKFEEFSE